MTLKIVFLCLFCVLLQSSTERNTMHIRATLERSILSILPHFFVYNKVHLFSANLIATVCGYKVHLFSANLIATVCGYKVCLFPANLVATVCGYKVCLFSANLIATVCGYMSIKYTCFQQTL